MCGSCWGKSRQNKAFVRPQSSPAMPPSPPAQPRQAAPSRKCNKCSWILKKIRYTDSKNGITVEKYVCTNENCANHGS